MTRHWATIVFCPFENEQRTMNSSRNIIASMTGFAALVGLSACHHKPVCEQLAAKNRSCAQAFGRYVDSKANQWNKSHPIPRDPGSASAPEARPATARTIGGPTGQKPSGMPGTKGPDNSRNSRNSGNSGNSGKPARRTPMTRAEAIRRMRAQRRKAAIKGLSDLFTGQIFLDSCRKAWTGSGKEDERLKKAATDCLAVSDCDAYVACIMNLKRNRNREISPAGK